MMGFIRLLTPRAWLYVAAAAVIIAFGVTVWALVGSREEIALLKADLKASGQTRDALTKQIKTQAAQGGQSYADAEARARDECRAAYDAGARRLRDDQAIAAGRYVPAGGSGGASR